MCVILILICLRLGKNELKRGVNFYLFVRSWKFILFNLNVFKKN